ncbi:hypothetical protein VIH_000316 [Vibrio cholerae CT 5369-93]|nr:hypothetical protein [Vibrio cholerae]EEY52608.1 hypothetical protein VIH_000316 [Vibrio cholerae CT 5369-93]
MKSAVLVIDVQSILFDPEPRPFESQLVLEKLMPSLNQLEVTQSQSFLFNMNSLIQALSTVQMVGNYKQV